MKKKATLIVLILLCSCHSNGMVQNGFSYDFSPSSIEVGVVLEKSDFESSKPIPFELSFGHPRKDMTPFSVNDTPGPVCIYVDNYNGSSQFAADETDYKTFLENLVFLKEIPSQDFWTDDFAYENSLAKGMTFSHHETVSLPTSYFASDGKGNGREMTFRFHVVQPVRYSESKEWIARAEGHVLLSYHYSENNQIHFSS